MQYHKNKICEDVPGACKSLKIKLGFRPSHYRFLLEQPLTLVSLFLILFSSVALVSPSETGSIHASISIFRVFASLKTWISSSSHAGRHKELQ